MAQYLISVEEGVVPFLERAARGHGVTVEEWISAWLEAATYQAAATTDGEAVADLEEGRTRIAVAHFSRRIIKRGQES